MGMRTRVVAAAIVVALVAMGACSRSGDDAGGDGEEMRAATGNRSDEKAADVGATAQATVAGALTATGAASASTGGGAPAEATVVDTNAAAGAPLPQGIGAPKVIKTAVIELEVPEGRFDAAFSKVPAIAAALGGFVSSSTSSQAGEAGADADKDADRQAAGSVVLRVPSEQFESARTELLALGELRRQQVKGDDVSAQLTDLDARLRNLRSQEEAIRLLMTKAKTLGETIEVQRQLGSVREQIEQLSAEQARLGDAVAMSTFTVNLAEPGAVARTDPDPSPLAEAVTRAVRGAQHVLAGTIVGLGYLLPLALLLGAAWLIARPVRARLSST